MAAKGPRGINVILPGNISFRTKCLIGKIILLIVVTTAAIYFLDSKFRKPTPANVTVTTNVTVPAAPTPTTTPSTSSNPGATAPIVAPPPPGPAPVTPTPLTLAAASRLFDVEHKAEEAIKVLRAIYHDPDRAGRGEDERELALNQIGAIYMQSHGTLTLADPVRLADINSAENQFKENIRLMRSESPFVSHAHIGLGDIASMRADHVLTPPSGKPDSRTAAGLLLAGADNYRKAAAGFEKLSQSDNVALALKKAKDAEERAAKLTPAPKKRA